MKNISLYKWDNGSMIIVFVFGSIIIGLIANILLVLNNDKKKK